MSPVLDAKDASGAGLFCLKGTTMRKLFVGLMTGALVGAGMVLPAMARHGGDHPPPELDVVYVSQFTGQVYGAHVPHSFPVSESSHNPTTFCVSVFTGDVHWFGGDGCHQHYNPVNVDWSGDFNVCLSVYTRELRALSTCPDGYVARVI